MTLVVGYMGRLHTLCIANYLDILDIQHLRISVAMRRSEANGRPHRRMRDDCVVECIDLVVEHRTVASELGSVGQKFDRSETSSSIGNRGNETEFGIASIGAALAAAAVLVRRRMNSHNE